MMSLRITVWTSASGAAHRVRRVRRTARCRRRSRPTAPSWSNRYPMLGSTGRWSVGAQRTIATDPGNSIGPLVDLGHHRRAVARSRSS